MNNNIENKKWDDIYKDFKETTDYRSCLARNLFPTFWKWLLKNYKAPVQKNPLTNLHIEDNLKVIENAGKYFNK